MGRKVWWDGLCISAAHLWCNSCFLRAYTRIWGSHSSTQSWCAPNIKRTVSFVFVQIAPAGESQTMRRNRDRELAFAIAFLSLYINLWPKWRQRPVVGNSWLLSSYIWVERISTIRSRCSSLDFSCCIDLRFTQQIVAARDRNIIHLIKSNLHVLVLTKESLILIYCSLRWFDCSYLLWNSLTRPLNEFKMQPSGWRRVFILSSWKVCTLEFFTGQQQ